jgi:hypothetical protein
VDRPRRLDRDPWIGIGEEPGDRRVGLPAQHQAGHQPHRRVGVVHKVRAIRGVGAREPHHQCVAGMRIEALLANRLATHRRDQRGRRVSGWPDPPQRDRRGRPHVGVVVGQPFGQRRSR